ncbi:MAG: hypothetical protein NTY01_25075 [Verrucomicrobia bacterium]|nr:hypothetical protein [Verrucomicrobiota bacterium]
MKAATWEMVNKRRAAEGRATFAFRPCVFCPQIAREYAADWLRMLCARFCSETGREPSVAELYAYWNLGPDKFQSLGYELSRVCAAARRAAFAVEAAVDAATERELNARAERLIATRPGGGQ